MKITDYGMWATIFGNGQRSFLPLVIIAKLNLSKIGPPMNHIRPYDHGINPSLLYMVLAEWPSASTISYTINGQSGILRNIKLEERIKYLQSNGKLGDSFTGGQVAKIVTEEFPSFYKHKSHKEAIIRYWESRR